MGFEDGQCCALYIFLLPFYLFIYACYFFFLVCFVLMGSPTLAVTKGDMLDILLYGYILHGCKLESMG
jgi:hypothetical protein